MTAGRIGPEQFGRAVGARVTRTRDPAGALCIVGADVLDVSGAGLILMSRGRSMGCIGFSDSATEVVEQLEYTLGEGPCLDACRTKSPVGEPHLDRTDVRWPAFAPAAVAVAVRAAFGFPLLVGGICIGALNLYQHEPGRLTTDQFANALVVAEVAARTILEWQQEAPAGTLAWQLEREPSHRASVHQAIGRISVQAGVSVADAHVLLRAYAFAHDQSVTDVARDVAAGWVRFD